MWLNPILQDMLRHIFQSCILESNQEILDLIQKVCKATDTPYTFFFSFLGDMYNGQIF